MDQGYNVGRGALPRPQSAEEERPVAQDVHVSHLPGAPSLDATGDVHGNATVTVEKPPKQPRKAPTFKPDPAKDFKESMIRLRLDDWKARAQVVHIPGQVDITSHFSPQWADTASPGIVSAKDGMNIFDGFDRTWFVPFDTKVPLSGVKDRSFYNRTMQLLEDEIKEKCQSQWDTNFKRPYLAPSRWEDVRHAYNVDDLVFMIAKARLEDGREQLPGYYQVLVLELGIDGKITYQRASVPSDIDLNGLVSRLDSWYPYDDEHSADLIKHFRHKLDSVSRKGDESQDRKIQAIYRQLCRFVEMERQDCELSQWIFRLWTKPDYSVPFGKSPDRVRTWTKLTEDKYQELLAGVRTVKYPVFVRPWKIRLRRWWPELEELEKDIENRLGEIGLSEEQLEMLDILFERRTEEEKGQAAKSKEALGMTRKATL